MLLDRHSNIRSHRSPRRSPLAVRASGMGEVVLPVRQLGVGDLPAVEAHLLGLAPSDRRARFLGNLPDAAISAYGRGLDRPIRTVGRRYYGCNAIRAL